MPTTLTGVKNVYWMYAILIDRNEFGISKDELKQRLLEKGVDTRDFFYSPKDQPILKKYVDEKDNFPITEEISKNGLYLPSGLALTKVQQKRVINAILEIKKSVSH